MVCILLDMITCLTAPVQTSPPVRKSCSKTKGSPSTAVNGQPMIAPAAKQIVALVARRTPVGVDVAGWNQAAQASIVVYMAKLDGRKAVHELSIQSTLYRRKLTGTGTPHSSGK